VRTNAGQGAAGRRLRVATVQTSGTASIPDVLRSLGASPAQVLASAGVEQTLFDDPDSLISLDALGRLMKRCVTTTGCQHFGLLVGQRGGLHSLGLVGLVARYSPDVRSALHKLGTYLHLHNGAAVTSVLETDDVAVLAYDLNQPDIEAVDQISDGAIAILFNILRSLCGPDWHPVEVRFAHRKPADVRPFRRFFGAPLRFDDEQTALVFSADWLDLRVPGAHDELQRLLQRQIDALEARHRGELPEQVRSVLRAGLLTGHASADQVAALFSVHSRTLRRRLNAFGTTFKALADESRFEIARQMLRDTRMDVSQIADSLDYADASAFTRAFRRWSDTTPAAWRAMNSL
jgi:AraC-like DNA-binding protein